jgi:hypothetical protein
VAEVVFYAIAKEEFVAEYLLVAGKDGLAGDVELGAWVGRGRGCAGSCHR